MDNKGNLRIILHHSSLPYKPTSAKAEATPSKVKTTVVSSKTKPGKNKRSN